MTEEKNQSEQTKIKVELQVVPCANNLARYKQNVEVLNHESQDDGCTGKIILTITCDGSKLTKADAGHNLETQQEVWVTAKVTKAETGNIPDIDVNIHEKCGSKLTKADSGKI